jgi:hypothetical protein
MGATSMSAFAPTEEGLEVIESFEVSGVFTEIGESGPSGHKRLSKTKTQGTKKRTEEDQHGARMRSR